MDATANVLISKLVNMIEEHGQLFRQAKVKNSTNPALLKVTEEEIVEPGLSEVELSYKTETEPNAHNIRSNFTITIAGEQRKALFTEILSAMDSLKHSNSFSCYSYKWCDIERRYYVSGEIGQCITV